jgi:hypothetical protein
VQGEGWPPKNAEKKFRVYAHIPKDKKLETEDAFATGDAFGVCM